MSEIAVKDLSKSFGAKQALAGVSLQVAHGEVHALLGLSGSGKSTLLRIVMGLMPADSGTVQIGQLTLNQTPPREWVRNLGYIPQEGGLFPHLSARQNVTLVAETLGWSASRIDSRLEETLDLTSVDPALLELHPRQLSGGQKQRIAVMRAAFLDPQVMILDEPFGALDPILRSDLQHDLHSVFQRLQKTVLLVTHDLSEAAYLADKVTLLRDGRVVQSGTLGEMIERPADDYVRRFINVQRPVQIRGWPST